jgi:hypothetical protein
MPALDIGNDPDMLEVGNGMSVNEDRAHFTMWCMLAASFDSGQRPYKYVQGDFGYYQK